MSKNAVDEHRDREAAATGWEALLAHCADCLDAEQGGVEGELEHD